MSRNSRDENHLQVSCGTFIPSDTLIAGIVSIEDDSRADAATVVPSQGVNEKADLVSRCSIISLLLVTVMELSFTLVGRVPSLTHRRSGESTRIWAQWQMCIRCPKIGNQLPTVLPQVTVNKVSNVHTKRDT